MLVAGKFFQVLIVIAVVFGIAFILRFSLSFTRKQGNRLMVLSRNIAARTGLAAKRKAK